MSHHRPTLSSFSIFAATAVLVLATAATRPISSSAPHNAGINCFLCHTNLKLGGTVFADTLGRVVQSGAAVSLIAPDGSITTLDRTDSSGNLYAHVLTDGTFRMKIGEVTSRTWHTIPLQRSCNTCHIPGGNKSATRSSAFPRFHTAIPSDNACTNCHHFPASMQYDKLGTTGVLTTSTAPLPVPGSQVMLLGQIIPFDPKEQAIVSVRPDVFAPGYFSIFDVILAAAKKRGIPVEYAYDDARKTHWITRINSVSGNYWYGFSYDAGSGNASEVQNRRANRWDEALWRPGVWIRVSQNIDSLDVLKREYFEEIARERAQGHVIPSVTLSINPTSYRGNPPGSERITVSRTYADVPVTAHNLRAAGTLTPYSKPFQPGVVTSMDLLLSLRDQGSLNVVTGVFYSYFAQNYIDSYYVVELGFPGVGVAHSSGRQGFVYVTENGAYNNLPNAANNLLHMTSDINVIHAPDFSYWRWIELGNPYYESKEPVTSVEEGSINEDFEAINRGFNLHEPYPNPFNGTLRITFNIFEPGDVTVSVFNVMGQESASLFRGRIENLGVHDLSWNPFGLPSGTYYVRLMHNRHEQVRRVLYVK